VVDDKRIRPGHWLGLVLSVTFRALTLMVGWQDGQPACRNPVPLIPRGSLPEHEEEENPRGDD